MYYFRGTHGCLLVFDIAQKSSFFKIQGYLSDIIKYAPHYTSLILIGNKYDLWPIREVTFEEANEFAKIHEIPYIECSALTDYGREEILNNLILNVQDNLILAKDFELKKSIQLKKNILYRDECC